MKEQTLIEMQRKVQEIEGINTAILSQVKSTNQFQAGILDILRRMPGYKEAVEKLKEDVSSLKKNETEDLNLQKNE